MLRDAEHLGGARALVARLVDAFGAQRICWGSDHPRTFELDYQQMVELAVRATDELDPGARAAVLRTTALGLWFGSR